MAMTVKRRNDAATPKVMLHRIADIRGGVGVKTDTLGGSYIYEGTPLGAKGTDGLAQVVKIGVIVTDLTASATTIEIAKGSHFKVGDFVTIDAGNKAYAITAIDTTNANKDVITVGTTLGTAVSAGGTIVEAAAQATGSTSTLKVAPQSIAGTTLEVKLNDNAFVDAWVIGVATNVAYPASVAAALKGIVVV